MLPAVWKSSPIDICSTATYSYHTYEDEGIREISLQFTGDKIRNSDRKHTFDDAIIVKDCVKSNVRVIHHSLVFSLRDRAGRNQSPVM